MDSGGALWSRLSPNATSCLRLGSGLELQIFPLLFKVSPDINNQFYFLHQSKLKLTSSLVRRFQKQLSHKFSVKLHLVNQDKTDFQIQRT